MSELLNNTLCIPCPEGFHVMDENERKALTFIADGPGVCLSDPDRHIIISAGYKQAGSFTSFFFNEKDAARSMEQQIAKPMAAYGYRKLGSAERIVGGRGVHGFGYIYESQGIAMYAESHVSKIGKTFYYIHYYTREALKEENMPVWESFLNEIRWEG
jgi:hypothetical protein